MSVLQQLVQRGDGGNASANLHADTADDGGDGASREAVEVEEPETGTAKTAADRARQYIQGAADLEAECFETAAGLRGEMAKVASEGGDTSEQEGAADFFEKIAMTLRVQRSYNAALEKGAVEANRTCEALKVASDLMQRGLLEVEDDQTMEQAVLELAKKDLKAVKVASEMFKDAAITNALGAAEKIASDKGQPEKLDGSMASWAKAHTWLYQ